jgi:hypothetical protein
VRLSRHSRLRWLATRFGCKCSFPSQLLLHSISMGVLSATTTRRRQVNVFSLFPGCMPDCVSHADIGWGGSGFSTWVLADFRSFSWTRVSRTKTHWLLHLANLRWASTDGLPFPVSAGQLADEFVVQLPEEAGGVWLDGFGSPFHFAASSVAAMNALEAMLKKDTSAAARPAPSAFGLVLKDDSRIVGESHDVPLQIPHSHTDQILCVGAHRNELETVLDVYHARNEIRKANHSRYVALSVEERDAAIAQITPTTAMETTVPLPNGGFPSEAAANLLAGESEQAETLLPLEDDLELSTSEAATGAELDVLQFMAPTPEQDVTRSSPSCSNFGQWAVDRSAWAATGSDLTG